MNGLNTNDELKMNISKSIVDLYFKETSSWFYKEEKECWDKLSLTLKELDSWKIMFKMYIFLLQSLLVKSNSDFAWRTAHLYQVRE